MSSDKASLRYAHREDIPTILALIRELADYENASEKVEATEEILAAPSPTTTPPPLHFPKALLVLSSSLNQMEP